MRTVLVPVIVLALTAVGCAAISDDEAGGVAPAAPPVSVSAPPTGSPPSESPQSGPPSDSPSAGGTATEGGTGSAGEQLGDPVATRTSAQGTARLRLDLYPVARSGRVVAVNFAVTQTGAPGAADTSFQVSGLFSDGNGASVDSSGFAIDGVQVVDVRNSKVHLPASDGNGQCLCSRDLSAAFIGRGQTMMFSATFAAPPESVGTVDVILPRFGTVTGVPVR